jgi:hypothetical protein
VTIALISLSEKGRPNCGRHYDHAPDATDLLLDSKTSIFSAASSVSSCLAAARPALIGGCVRAPMTDLRATSKLIDYVDGGYGGYVAEGAAHLNLG